jgi:F-type H+-transporting ATPase subunit delta
MAADNTDQIELLTGEVDGLRRALSGSDDLVAFLGNPTIEVETKKQVLEQVFADKLSPMMWRFINLLVEKRREPLFADILEATHTLLDERAGRVRASVRTAQPLADTQQERLREQLAKITGKEVSLAVEDDPSLVAGFVARVGDTVYDASLRAQLERLRNRLKSADLGAAASDTGS